MLSQELGEQRSNKYGDINGFGEQEGVWVTPPTMNLIPDPQSRWDS